MLTTRSGFTIGLRRGWSDWQRDLGALLTWAKANKLSMLDVGADLEAAKATQAAGLKIGTVDLPAWKQLISANAATRKEAVAKAAAFIEGAAGSGVRHFFTVMLPEDTGLKRSANFSHMVESFSQLAPVFEKHNAAAVIEGYPGAGALCCTPESLRAFFKAVPSPAMAINYDPSHLIRMNIDHIRFLNEFASRIKHVHGKDTELLPENVYDLGTEISPTLQALPGFAGPTWRYTIPGHGQTRWPKVFELVKQANYQGAVTIELEDANFNGTEEGEKRGILAAAAFLQTC
jgi:sugar phosphate isomerase/epimerase